MRLGVVTVLISIIGVLLLWEPREAELRVVFFDVGQGDSIFIESPTGVQVLIDTGAGSQILRALGREMGFFDRTIDLVVATHPDKDHIGGFPDVFLRYEVETVLLTENKNDTSAAHAFLKAVEDEGADVVHARTGMHFDLGAGATLDILFPNRDTTGWESNTSSIVARVAFGNTSVFLTGDAPAAIEEHLVAVDMRDGSNDMKSDVLKVGHHGSRTSTSEQFLKWIDPKFAVISAEKDSRYGHPHREVTDRLDEHDIMSISTAEVGHITFWSDGERIYQK